MVTEAFQLDNLPPGVDPRQCFHTEEFLRVPKDISLAEEISKYIGHPPFPPNLDIQDLRIYIDERLSLVLEEGFVTFEIFIPSDFRAESTAIFINGELGLAMVGRDFPEAPINRIEDLDWSSMVTQSQRRLKEQNGEAVSWRFN